ncbi:ACD shelterin complex subunit and telomerase recruitment factor [Rhinolophus ferrumequinum]|uniref:ACD shelterin complex subunit and telomerase recruitment factor n=1 Tax=Rhinolophus ferrumequinum TaxID=59479 RepID=A0A671FRB6_RHIFE|nr:adrenocortical dysplasia protein homolog isoform X1 [Rhinolophus ferrumequinum]KAF6287430.1 ACD shelterin complex subunit and telomerase recruitment factor [Rhinolophus ferrumequinum]
MAGLRTLVLRPWIRELVLESETLSSPRAGQLLQVLQEAEGPGTSHAPDKSEVGAALLVSDGTHSIRCLVTREALNASDWEEKEFGFRGAEGRLLLLQDCGVRVQVPEGEGGLPSEFYLQVNRFCLLPTEQPRDWVTGCNQDPDVQKKLNDCLEEHLSESTSPNAGLSLSQLLEEVQEEQEHQGALVCRAESCLMLSGPCAAPLLTRWAASRSRALEEAVYTLPSLWLHISENDQQILNSLGRGRRAQGPDLPPPDLALEELSLTLSPSLLSSSGTPTLPSHVSSEESATSVSLLPALSPAAPDPVQNGSSQPLPALCSAPGPLSPSSSQPSHVSSSLFLRGTPSLSPLGHIPSPHQAHVTRPQKSSLEFKELGLPLKNWLHSPRIRSTEGVLESSPVWEPPKRHRDGSAFQYEYEPPCTSLCAQVQDARLPPQLLAWALHFLMEPQLESEQTQL